jgi:hypothetical protein
MFTTAEARDLMDEVFEKEALVIGGLAATREIDDELVWRLVKSLDVIREKTLRALEEKEQSILREETDMPLNMEPHPAIEDFLLKIRKA